MTASGAEDPRLPDLVALYVPGDRPDRFVKALAAGADQVIIDLEDAVSAEHKDQARSATETFLKQRAVELAEDPGPTDRDSGLDSGVARKRSAMPTVAVRPNAPGTPWQTDDLAMLATVPQLDAVRLPKIESPADVDAVLAALSGDQGTCDRLPAITCLIETALGVEHALAIASHPAVTAIALGEADLRAELGITTNTGLDWIRVRIVVAARAAGLPPPSMAAFTNVADLDALEESCRAGAGLGFVGRTAVHPRQVDVIRRAFAPTPAELAHAHEVLAVLADRGAAVLPDGRMVDEAMAVGARRILDRAHRPPS